MTEEEIINIAWNIFPISDKKRNENFITLLVHFARKIAEKEREACAEIAEKQRYAMHISLTSYPEQNGTAVGIANQIRARGQE